MKLISSLGAVTLTGLALATPPVVHAPDAEGCCEPTAAEPQRSVYVSSLPTTDVTGKATGRVVFDGEKPPVNQDLSITEAQSKGCVHEGATVDRRDVRLLVGKDKGIANAVVTINVPDQKLVVPEKPIVLDQVKCRFDQHVVIAPVGATISYKNSDEVPHNVHTYSIRNKAFNRTLTGNSSYEQKLEHAEVIQVKCDIHPWMSAYVFVSDTNFAAKTDEHGAFEIAGLPPGEYTAKVWHEQLGKTEVAVVIGETGESTPVSVPMKPKAKRTRRRR